MPANLNMSVDVGLVLIGFFIYQAVNRYCEMREYIHQHSKNYEE